MNPLDRDRNNKITLANGNLEATGTSNQYGFVRGTLAPASGKFYYEVITNGGQGGAYGVVEGTAPYQVSGSNPDYTIASAYRNYAYLYNSGFQVYIDNSLAYTGPTVSDGDIVGVAVDVDAGKVWFSHNGTWQGSGTQNPATGTGGYSPTNLKTACPLFQDGAGANVPTGKFNFGQRDFKYTPPTNFKSFCTQNVPDPTITDGSDHFETVLWTGDGTNNRKITTPFSPDFVWAKFRNQAYSHGLYDTVRGDDKRLASNSTGAEGTVSLGMESDGFVVEGASSFNDNNDSFIAWVWDGGNLATGTYSSYDQSQNWSANTSGTVFGGVVGDLFDSATSTGFYPGVTATAGTYDVTLTFSPGIACTSLRVYTKDKQSSATGSVSVNGGTHQSVPGNDSWTTLTAPSTLNSLVLRRVASSTINNTFRFTAIEVNGKILIDPGVIPVGSLNSSFYNQSQQWSNGWTGNSGTYGRVPTNAFDGDLSTKAFPGNNNANEYVEYSFTAINVNTSLEFYLSFDAGGSQRGQLWVNDTNVTSQLGAGNAQWYTVTGQSTLSKIKILTTATNYYVNLHAVRVDGKL